MDTQYRFTQFVNKKVALTYREGLQSDDIVTVNATLVEANDFGIMLLKDTPGKTDADNFRARFYPWTAIVNIDLSESIGAVKAA